VARIQEQIKENPMIAGAIAVMTVFTGINVTTVVQGVRYFDSLASKEYVSGMLATERKIAADELADRTVQSDKKFQNIETKIDRVRAFTEIVPQLRNLLTLRCMGTRGLDDIIVRLEDEYRDLTGETFAEQSCERLLAVR
jgi:hypothetical protein